MSSAEKPQVHGTNPVFLIDKITRGKIFESAYYKERCFGLDADSIIDRAIELKSIGGLHGRIRKPTPFLCLLLKLLQINPDSEIVLQYIEQDEFRYLRALGAFYLRLVERPVRVYQTLEPLYDDYSKLVSKTGEYQVEILYMDQFIDGLLRNDIYMDIALPHLPRRMALEEQGLIPPRISSIQHEIDFEEPEQMQVEKKIKRKRHGRLGEGFQNPQKEPAPESLEYWQQLRAQLGLRPLKGTEPQESVRQFQLKLVENLF